MGEPVRPNTPPIGKTVKLTDRYWTVYRWIDRKEKEAAVVRRGYNLKGAEAKAKKLNRMNEQR